MSKTVSTFLAALCLVPATLCLAVGGGSATFADDESKVSPPTTTTMVTTEGNPWHG
ncbi:hypothetical protein [Actinokineospora enzanensis]|uniref:hypothetical protein n=1 Tax=Actinokineospora enzanensis TaxID=155975 RepID=UPI00037CA44E|nr:hypothetical protein [Actinokineospora enzanensis]